VVGFCDFSRRGGRREKTNFLLAGGRRHFKPLARGEQLLDNTDNCSHVKRAVFNFEGLPELWTETAAPSNISDS
jgi:hypothetical protein